MIEAEHLEIFGIHPNIQPVDDARSSMDEAIIKCLAFIQKFMDDMDAEYPIDAFGKFEKTFFNIGSWFNTILSDNGNEFYKYINSSEWRKNQTNEIINKADAAANEFQRIKTKDDYDRPVCKRKIETLYFSIKNLSNIINSKQKM